MAEPGTFEEWLETAPKYSLLTESARAGWDAGYCAGRLVGHDNFEHPPSWTRERLTAVEARLGWGSSGRWPVPESILLWARAAEKLLSRIDELLDLLVPMNCYRCREMITEADADGHWKVCPESPARKRVEALEGELRALQEKGGQG